MVYQYKSDMAKVHKVEAQVVGEVCEELSRTIGLTPENLVEVSKDIDAPLHDEFCWDNLVAANKYRKEQARKLIKSIEVVTEVLETNTPVRAFCSVPSSENTPVYQPIKVVVNDDKMYSHIMDECMKSIKQFKAKYQVLSNRQELKELFDAIDGILNK